MTCEKIRYDTRRLGKIAARIVSSEAGVQMRSYACPECHGWHLATVNPAPQRPSIDGRLSRARRLAPGQTLEELAAQMRRELIG